MRDQAALADLEDGHDTAVSLVFGYDPAAPLLTVEGTVTDATAGTTDTFTLESADIGLGSSRWYLGVTASTPESGAGIPARYHRLSWITIGCP